MKLPLLPIHVLTEKSLREIRDKVVQETKQLTERQVCLLLEKNGKLLMIAKELGRRLKAQGKIKKKKVKKKGPPHDRRSYLTRDI